MKSMFGSTNAFNVDISKWNVSSVTSMYGMFEYAVFNVNLCAWKEHDLISKSVTYMFDESGCVDTSKPTYDNVCHICPCYEFTDADFKDAVNLFLSDEASAKSTYGHISNWCTGRVTIMDCTFCDEESFNADISKWNTSSAVNMWEMFDGAIAFNGDISKWDTSSVTNMEEMLYG